MGGSCRAPAPLPSAIAGPYAALPCFLGEPDKALVRVPVPGEPVRWELRLLVHPDLRRSPRVRAVMDFLEEIACGRDVLDPAW